MSFDRRSCLVLALLALSLPLGLIVLGGLGVVVYIALWLAALPILLAPLRATLVAELPGVVFLFLTAAFADNLDVVLGAEQRISLALVALSFVYLLLRLDDVRAAAASPLVLLLALFYVQQLASARWFRADDVPHLVENRVSLLAALLTGAVLVRRSEDGVRVVLWILVLAVLVSVPIMLYEVAVPGTHLFSPPGPVSSGPLRAGGLFGQANVVGIAIDLAIAALLALRLRGEVSRGAAAGLGLAFAVGIVACASRGALIIALLLLAARGWAWARRALGRPPIATALLVTGVLTIAVPALARAVLASDKHLADVGFEGVDRLNEVMLALTGATDDLQEDDSGHMKLAEASLTLSSERPLFGFGTEKFSVALRRDEDGRGAHVQWLQILGENGAVGLAFYFVFLAALAVAAARRDVRPDDAVLLLLSVWVMVHFETHDLHNYRFTMLPLAYVCGRSIRARHAVATHLVKAGAT